MDNLNFRFHLMPYVTNPFPSGIAMQHKKVKEDMYVDEDFDTSIVTEKLESAMISIYYYERSYFQTNVTKNVLPTTKYADKLDSSENFCLNLEWDDNRKNSTYSDITGQKECSNNGDSTDYERSDRDPSTGISFRLWKFKKNMSFKCKETENCSAKCAAEGG